MLGGDTKCRLYGFATWIFASATFSNVERQLISLSALIRV